MRESSVENGLNYEFKIKMQTKGLILACLGQLNNPEAIREVSFFQQVKPPFVQCSNNEQLEQF